MHPEPEPSAALPKRNFECLSYTDLERDAGWWEIYEAAFAAGEREPPAVILESLRQGMGLALRARVNGGTIGLASLHLLRQPPAVFLVYLAVARVARGMGWGGLLLHQAWEDAIGRLREQGVEAGGMVWEVGSPTPDAPVSEQENYHRLLDFYGRNGGVILPCDYLQPPVDGISLLPMHLFYRPALGMPLPDQQQTVELVRAMYWEKYGAVNGIPEEVLEHCLRSTEEVSRGG